VLVSLAVLLATALLGSANADSSASGAAPGDGNFNHQTVTYTANHGHVTMNNIKCASPVLPLSL
jgi:hypothetical protein